MKLYMMLYNVFGDIENNNLENYKNNGQVIEHHDNIIYVYTNNRNIVNIQNQQQKNMAREYQQQKATQQRVAQQRAAQQRVAQQRAAQQRAAQQRAAQQRAAQQRAAQQRAAQQRASKRINRNIRVKSNILSHRFVRARYSRPPYNGSLFWGRGNKKSGSLIGPSDISTFQSLRYINKSLVYPVFDRRTNKWGRQNMWKFEAKYSDGPIINIFVNANDWRNRSQAYQIGKSYAHSFGKIPKILRKGVPDVGKISGRVIVWIHNGNKPWGGGRLHPRFVGPNFTVHHQGYNRSWWGNIREETLLHEGAHTVIDELFYPSKNRSIRRWGKFSSEWKRAVALDKQASGIGYISNYARNNPLREDVAESFVFWVAYRYFRDRMSNSVYNKVRNILSNRIKVFDKYILPSDMTPISNNGIYRD